jgi:23S rRNA (pseudouridine1915-N3)-methyltransferase
MKLLQVGKTKKSFTEEAMKHYQKRIRKYARLEVLTVPAAKGKGSTAEQQEEEEKAIRRQLPKDPFLILLDEGGEKMSSEGFSRELEGSHRKRGKELVFAIGGANGFSEALKRDADRILSLSEMTFSHQLVRVLFLEQLFRALSISNGDPYHNA